MQSVLFFWYFESFSWVWQRYLRSLATLNAYLALGTTLRNLGKPLFQDYTWQGRVIGFLFRILRLSLGLLLYVLVSVAYLLTFAFWLAFPLLCLVAIIGFFFGPTLTPLDPEATSSFLP